MATKAEKLIEVLEPLAEGNGLELVTVEVAGTKKNPILRVCLDTPQGGINLDQLAEAREWVDAAVDELDPFKESFVLEVSSPGIDRPLRKLSDFERFAGEDEFIRSIAVEECDEGVITMPVPVAKMHGWSAKAKEADPELFIAGLM